MKQVLLAGCGNIGFRHLQALCTVADPIDITIVEPDSTRHDLITAELDQTAATGHTYAVTTAIPSPSRRFDLVVVATAAAERRAVVDEILTRHRVGVMILEKVLFQTIADIEHVGRRLEADGVRAFVNCGRRTFEGYRSLRSRLESPVDIEVRGAGLGLASNTVHFLDLLEFVNDDRLVRVDSSRLQPGSKPGKRAGVVELFGEITAELANGAALSVESLDAHPTRIEVHLRSGSAHVVVDELARTQTEAGESSPFASQNVSETTEIYQDALDLGECALTPYADSARQHRLYLSAVRRHLGLSDERDEPCPVS